ncbi:hypothetical protein KPL71_027019 [Citrus sinensis]|uniref:Uncharacterized protein n=1 Tax=Citrus sinensis TaxID=2711 RepID=A0ACB8I442_CITSI|nr:hypothetical protein KPL71_027019 [Citrus sinensis]
MDPLHCRASSFSSSSSGKTSDSKHVTDLSRANTVIPKPIQWKDVNLPEEWILEGAAPPAIPKQLEPNTELQNVTQYSNGKVKLSFRRSSSFRFSDKASCSSIPSLERKFTKVPSVINLPFQSQPRFSTSDLPSSSISSVDYTTKSNPITTRKKTTEWKLFDSNRTVDSEHPPLRSVIIEHGEPPVDIRASPYKIPKPNDPEVNLSSIIQQNNFCNTNLNTIGKQLTRLENQFQQSTISVSPSPKPVSLKSDSDKKLKEPIFKPFQVSKTSQKLVQESKSDFAKAIREKLDRIEAASSSSSKVQIAPDTPQSSKIDTPQLSRIGVLDQDQVSIASSDLEAFTEEPIPKANKIHWELALPTSKSPPDLTIDNRPSALNQARYNASSVYEWNIDGMSEYNVLGVLQQMTMAANAYKTQSGTSDKAITEILIAGFTGQLKGWWDNLLTKLQQLDILNAIQIDENGAPILDELNNPIQDAVATLILTISLHFIGDPSHLRDKNAELLHNLRCRKLSDFNDYKTTFFTRLFLRDDANHVTWKEKFLACLPTLLGEKVRNSIKALFNDRIPYDELTYGELVSFVNKEGLKICQDLKLQKRLKQELRQSKQELGGFCKQFNYDPFKTSTSKDCNGHTARFCKMNRRLHELGLDEEIFSKIAPLLVSSSDSESSWSGDNDPLQVDELFDSDSSASSNSDSDSDNSYLKKINVLTKDQEIFLELVKHISDPNLQREYLDKLLKTMDSSNTEASSSKTPIVKKNSYDLTEILDKKKTKKSTPNIQDLQKEIKDIKLEIKDLKEKQKTDSATIQLLLQKQLQDTSDKEVMAPKKRSDKGKAPASQEPSKELQATPSKEKLLSSAMPIKSWIELVEEHEAKYKSISSEDQVKQWMSSITKSPELMIALQSLSQVQPKEEEKPTSKDISKPSSQNIVVSGESSSSQIVLSQPTPSKKTSDWFDKAHFQNIISMEDGFYHSDPFQSISKFFPQDWFFKPWDLTKPQSYYQSILEITDSVKFKHLFLSKTHSEPAYSTATILKVLSPNQWGDLLHNFKTFPLDFETRLPHCRSFSHWDYQQAWYNTKAMEQLLASRSKSSVADSTDDEDDDDEPTVSLGDENEDDCFRIFSPIKHCK